jgi:hypothetical protein
MDKPSIGEFIAYCQKHDVPLPTTWQELRALFEPCWCDHATVWISTVTLSQDGLSRYAVCADCGCYVGRSVEDTAWDAQLENNGS